MVSRPCSRPRVVPFFRSCTLTLALVDGCARFPYTEKRVGVFVGRGGLPSFSKIERVTGRSNQKFAGDSHAWFNCCIREFSDFDGSSEHEMAIGQTEIVRATAKSGCATKRQSARYEGGLRLLHDRSDRSDLQTRD